MHVSFTILLTIHIITCYRLKIGGGAPEVYFTGDTFDPRKLVGLLEMLKARNLLQKTLFNIISKSGTTTETMATLMIIRKALGDGNWQQQITSDDWTHCRQCICSECMNNPSILRWHAASCSGWCRRTIFSVFSSRSVLSRYDSGKRRNPRDPYPCAALTGVQSGT